MSKVTITITTNNDAFADGQEGTEVARILREYADWIDGDGLCDERNLRDINGNTVGKAERTARERSAR